MIIGLIVRFETSFDKEVPGINNVYRLNDRIKTGESQFINSALSPNTWAPYLIKEIPEIIDYCRVENETRIIQEGEERTYTDIVFTDPSFIQFFDVKWLAGSKDQALAKPYEVLVTETYSKKLFGDENPVGKFLNVQNDQQDYKIIGLIADPEHNTSLKYQCLASFNSLNADNYFYFEHWRYHTVQTFLKLQDNANIPELEKKFEAFVIKHIEDQFRDRYRPFLQKYTDIHNSNVRYNSDPLYAVNTNFLMIVVLIGFFIFSLACINYINISTAQAMHRHQEVCIRKIHGSGNIHIIMQFLMESFITSFIAAFGSLGLISAILNTFAPTNIQKIYVEYYTVFDLILYTLSMALFATITAGIYPAVQITGTKILSSLRGKHLTSSRKYKVRDFLVIFQLIIAGLMVLGTFIFVSQINYMHKKQLGFKTDDIFIMDAPDSMELMQLTTFKNELLQNPDVEKVSFGSYPGFGFMWGRFLPEGSGLTDGNMHKLVGVDYDYLEHLEMKFVAGRNFNSSFSTDSTSAIIINQAAAREFGWDDPIGKTINWEIPLSGERDRTVIGVVEDYHIEELSKPIAPLMIVMTPNILNNVIITFNNEPSKESLNSLKEMWLKRTEVKPYSGDFLKLALERRLSSLRELIALISSFTVIAIIIACLGLFGVISFTVKRRQKEIGIRKVLGSTVTQVYFLILKRFVIILGAALLVAFPIGYFVFNNLLMNYAYRINISPLIYIFTSILLLAVTVFTVSYHSIKAALTNPAKVIKCE
jgi:putative ABC transport system permease protein